jgi:hypothetical protein
MTRYIEEPVTVQKPGAGGSPESVTTHPAFAQIGVSRVTGYTALYDSDFMHNHYMVIRIAKSDLRRHLNRDWHYSDFSGFVEVAMTEAQWATFVSSPNMGGGVPCTLERFNYEQVPGLPDPIARHHQFGDEVKEDLSELLAELTALDETIDTMGLPKGKAAALKEKVRAAKQKVHSSIPWVAESFDKHMATTTERAKQEIHGYMTGVLQRAGIDALAGGALPLQIEDKTDG